MHRGYDWTDTICPVCGKNFIPAGQHVYRLYEDRSILVCSYHCALQSERDAQARAKEKPKSHGWYTLKEIFDKSEYEISNLTYLCKTGKLPATKFNNRWFVRKEDWEAFLKGENE